MVVISCLVALLIWVWGSVWCFFLWLKIVSMRALCGYAEFLNRRGRKGIYYKGVFNFMGF